ncbi:DUF4396 domain-containing protein [Oleiagrimonas sp.]|uniref:DUF4396 domain-containing protein n=1 Tax=Oleiagrimonas sp. TaxID=2010330 RepID=UPI0031BA5E73
MKQTLLPIPTPTARPIWCRPAGFSNSISRLSILSFLSLCRNVLMAGMVPTMLMAMKHVPGAHNPSGVAFWFVMSMSLLVGFVTAYPMNWWLVSRHLKHGMMTVRAPGQHPDHQARSFAHEKTAMRHVGNKASLEPESMHRARGKKASRDAIAGMTMLSIALLALGLALAVLLA